MKNAFLLLIIAASFSASFSQNNDSTFIRSVFDEGLTNGQCYANLVELCTVAPKRLSGSPGAEEAVKWANKTMKDAGIDKVWLQPVRVPHWVRGEKEMGVIRSKKMPMDKEVPVCALGGSVGTGPDGISAEVIEVQNFEELETLGEEKIKGKIVFYNRPMDPKHIHTFHAYGGAVDQRSQGAIQAAKLGAVGTIVRSMTLAQDDFPHTGGMRYEEGVTRVPTLAVSTNGADLLHEWLQKDEKLKFFMRSSCETLPDEQSYNVIGEIRGTEFPNEIILVGGHLDAWDLGVGAHDDGAGCVQALEALRILKATGYKPKRTLRVVFYMNEENGLMGGKKYAEEAKEKKLNHIAAIESDAGGFTPRGFSIKAEDAQVANIQRWEPILGEYGLRDIFKGWGGADISTLEDHGTVLIGYVPDSQRYFDYHHSDNDQLDKINKRELELGAASLAALTYLLSEYGVRPSDKTIIKAPNVPSSK